jgi:hypothetical protein
MRHPEGLRQVSCAAVSVCVREKGTQKMLIALIFGWFFVFMIIAGAVLCAVFYPLWFFLSALFSSVLFWYVETQGAANYFIFYRNFFKPKDTIL